MTENRTFTIAQKASPHTVCNQNAYYPFGMIMPGRSYSAGTQYRFGFNGQEHDTELNPNITTAEYWEYDSRLGRRWNIDPVVKHWESPYACLNNSPNSVVDIKGNDGTAVVEKAVDKKNDKGKVVEKAGSKNNLNIVTITVNYYYNPEQLNSKYETAEAKLKEAAEAYNKTNYTVLGEDGEYYQVKFDIKVIPIAGAEQDALNIKASNDFIGEDPLNRTGNIAGSDILTPTQDQLKNDPLGLGSKKTITLLTPGIEKMVTQGNDLGILLFNIFSHEIGHNLGGAHEDGGVMDDLTTDDFNNTTHKTNNGPEFRNTKITHMFSITSKNIQAILRTMWTGRSSERPGRINKVN